MLAQIPFDLNFFWLRILLQYKIGKIQSEICSTHLLSKSFVFLQATHLVKVLS